MSEQHIVACVTVRMAQQFEKEMGKKYPPAAGQYEITTCPVCTADMYLGVGCKDYLAKNKNARVMCMSCILMFDPTLGGGNVRCIDPDGSEHTAEEVLKRAGKL